MGVNSLPWYYVPSLGTTGEFVSMIGDEWHHCYHVLRLSSGNSLILTDGKGHCMEGILRSASQHEGSVELTADLRNEYNNPRHYNVSIGIAPTKNIDRTEFAVEKLVELGVDEICFLDCKHAERKHIRLNRFEKIMVAAAKQSRKIFFPALKDLIPPVEYIQQKRTVQPDLEILCCHLSAESLSLFENYSQGRNVLMLIGPEGGFASDEIEKMNELQVKMVQLGPFRLRVETAAIVACANIHLVNDLKNTI